MKEFFEEIVCGLIIPTVGFMALIIAIFFRHG